MTIRTVLFDLDGTLADTAPDLGFALNTLLQQENRAPIAYERIRAEASHGARGLIQLGFGIARDDLAFEPLRQRFLKIYADNICTHSQVFPGMHAVLSEIKQRGLCWGIVTNKPAFLTNCLVKELGLDTLAACVISGDTTAHSKPHPEPLLYACKQIGGSADECLYIGDAERDIEAGRRAGMKTLVAKFGYLRASDTPQHWGADGMIEQPRDVLAWLNTHG